MFKFVLLESDGTGPFSKDHILIYHSVNVKRCVKFLIVLKGDRRKVYFSIQYFISNKLSFLFLDQIILVILAFLI